MDNFVHLKRKLLAEQVAEQLYHSIVDTPLACGTRLPNEFQLCEKYGVGRSTIREAVKQLASRGIVEVRHGSGTYVLCSDPDGGDPMDLRSLRDKTSLALDLVDVRLLLEPGIAEMAAQYAAAEDVARLRELCRQMEARIAAGETYIEEDIAFHTCIAECSKNAVVAHLIPMIDSSIMMFVNMTQKQLLRETMDTHRMIVDAIAAHDGLGTRNAMMMHIAYNRSYIKSLCEEPQP